MTIFCFIQCCCFIGKKIQIWTILQDMTVKFYSPVCVRVCVFTCHGRMPQWRSGTQFLVLYCWHCQVISVQWLVFAGVALISSTHHRKTAASKSGERPTSVNWLFICTWYTFYFHFSTFCTLFMVVIDASRYCLPCSVQCQPAIAIDSETAATSQENLKWMSQKRVFSVSA